MHVNVAIEGRNCAPNAVKLIAKWLPPISFATLSVAAARRGLLEHSLLPSGAPHLKELLEAWHQQQPPGRSARLRPSPSGSSGVQTAGDVRLQLRRQLLEELHHRRRSALQLLYRFRLYSRLNSKKRAVERYTASPPPTTPLQSSTALYSFIQLYTALYIIQLWTVMDLIRAEGSVISCTAYTVNSIQRYTITLCFT